MKTVINLGQYKISIKKINGNKHHLTMLAEYKYTQLRRFGS